MKAGIYELPDGSTETVFCDEGSYLPPIQTVRSNRNWIGSSDRVTVRLFDMVGKLVEVRIFDVLDADVEPSAYSADGSEPMPTNTTVRFCDKCGVRTTHDGDRCLVCASPKNQATKETEDVGTSSEPSEPEV